MSAPIPNTINIGHAIATIPANASNITATIANTKSTKHKVIIVVPPFIKRLLVSL